jgi:large subunit ribosomal protein L33
MREYVALQCGTCKTQNYRTQKTSHGNKKLELRKHCQKCRKHTVHVVKKK